MPPLATAALDAARDTSVTRLRNASMAQCVISVYERRYTPKIFTKHCKKALEIAAERPRRRTLRARPMQSLSIKVKVIKKGYERHCVRDSSAGGDFCLAAVFDECSAAHCAVNMIRSGTAGGRRPARPPQRSATR